MREFWLLGRTGGALKQYIPPRCPYQVRPGPDLLARMAQSGTKGCIDTRHSLSLRKETLRPG